MRANTPVTCHACFLILYTVTVRFPWECAESVPRIDQGFTLPIAATRERSLLLPPVSRLFAVLSFYRAHCRPIDKISSRSPRLSILVAVLFSLSDLRNVLVGSHPKGSYVAWCFMKFRKENAKSCSTTIKTVLWERIERYDK